MDLHEYLTQQKEVIAECVRVLKPTGSICWQVGNYVDNGEIIPLDILLYPIFRDLKLHMRNRIIWHFGHGLHANKRFSGRYEVILWLGSTQHNFVRICFPIGCIAPAEMVLKWGHENLS